MAQSRDSHPNEYDIPNEYEQDTTSTRPKTPAAVPVGVAKPSATAFQPRPLPPAGIYVPTIGGGRRARRDAENHIQALQIANQVAGAAEAFEQGLSRLVEASQRREMAEQRRTQIPVRIEIENLDLGEQVLQRRGAFATAVDEQRDEQVKRDRLRAIKTEDFDITMHNKRATKLEAEARERAAAARLANAEEIGRRRAEAAFHQANETAFEKEADAERERRRRDQERHRRGQAGTDEDVPADLQEPLATERTVATSRQWVEGKIAQIRRRAQQAGRDLTPEEEELIRQYRDAADTGEASIRRRGASDL